MNTRAQSESIEKRPAGQFSKDGLSRISKSILALQKAGHHVIAWSQFGKPPFENFVVETHLPVEKIAVIEPLFAEKSFKEILILHRGVPPMPGFYNVRLTFQNL